MKLLLIFALYFFTFNLFSQTNENIVIQKKIETINDLKGTTIFISIINFESPSELKALRNLSKKYADVAFIAVIDDLPDTELSQLKEQLKYHVFLSKDENDKIFDTYETGKFKTFPLYVLLDKNGEIKYKKNRVTKKLETIISKHMSRVF